MESCRIKLYNSIIREMGTAGVTVCKEIIVCMMRCRREERGLLR